MQGIWGLQPNGQIKSHHLIDALLNETFSRHQQHDYLMPANDRAIVFFGVPADQAYTLAVLAYRKVDEDLAPDGIIRTPFVVAPSSPYVPELVPAFSGNILGTLADVPVLDIVLKVGGIEDNATRGAPGTTPIGSGSVTGNDVGATINVGGGVANNKVGNSAIVDLSTYALGAFVHDYAGWMKTAGIAFNWYDVDAGSSPLAACSVTTAPAGSQVVAIDGSVVLIGEGSSADTDDLRIIRNDGTVICTYTGLRIAAGFQTPIYLQGIDAAVSPNVTYTYRLQFQQQGSGRPSWYNVSLKATGYWK